MRRPRVLFTLRSLVGGGVETTALTLHSHLRALSSNHQLSPDGETHWSVLLALLEDFGELRERSLKLSGILRPRGGPKTAAQREDLLFALRSIPRTVGYGCRLRTLLRRLAPEIVFTHSGIDLLGALRLIGTQGAIWTAGVGSDVLLDLMAKHPALEGPIRRVLRFFYGSPRYIVTASRGLAQVMIEEHGVPADRLEVIGNPVELARLAKTPPQRPEGLPPMFILGVGRLTKVKGFDLLIRAAAELEKELGPIPLIILGDGEERPALVALAQQLGYLNLQLPGFVDNPWDYMRAAQMMVISSHIEGFSNVTVEAMACATPVIVTDCPHGPREIVSQGRDGLLVGRGDSRALADGIASLLVNPEKRAHFVHQGLRRCQDFDAPVIAAQYFRFFDKVLTARLGSHQ